MRSHQVSRNIRAAVVLAFACLAVGGWAWKSEARGDGGQQPAAQQPAGQPARAQQPAAADAPVEQTRKNIQVLKGLPESELLPLMNLVSASLGVRCNFCHIRKGEDWVWESDEHEHKRIARRMMTMTMQLNQTHLADFNNQRISCYTCHRGTANPLRLPPLPIEQAAPPGGGAGPGRGQGQGQGQAPAQGQPSAQGQPAGQGQTQGQGQGQAPAQGAGQATGAGQAQGAAQGQPAAPAARPTPPTPEQILEKYVAAVGGREAIAKLQSAVMSGTREATQGRVWPIEVTTKGADKFLAVAQLPAMGQNPAMEMRQSFNGAKGWVKNARGVREMSPEEVTALRRGARDLAAVKIAEPFPKMTFGGRGRVGDRAAYVLVHTSAPGVTDRFFFDQQTGLLLRVLTLRETVLSPIPEQVDYEDYREVDGVKLPFTVRLSNIDTFFSYMRKFTEIKLNPPVDDSIFAMPAATPRQ